MTDQTPSSVASSAPPADLKGGFAQVLLATLASTAGFWAWMAISPLQKTYATEMGLDEGQISLMLATPVLVGALGRILVGAMTDRFGGRKMFTAVLLLSVPAVLLVIMTSSALAWIFSMERAGIAMADMITQMTTNPWMFLIAVNILLLVLGMFVEGTALMIILVPLLKPVVEQLGIDPVHFGIVMILNLSIGTLTPPVGTVLLMVCNLTHTKIVEFFRDGWPFLLALIVALLLVTFVPFISTALI